MVLQYRKGLGVWGLCNAAFPIQDFEGFGFGVLVQRSSGSSSSQRLESTFIGFGVWVWGLGFGVGGSRVLKISRIRFLKSFEELFVLKLLLRVCKNVAIRNPTPAP